MAYQALPANRQRNGFWIVASLIRNDETMGCLAIISKVSDGFLSFVIPDKRSADPESIPLSLIISMPVQIIMLGSAHALISPPPEEWIPDRLRFAHCPE